MSEGRSMEVLGLSIKKRPQWLNSKAASPCLSSPTSFLLLPGIDAPIWFRGLFYGEHNCDIYIKLLFCTSGMLCLVLFL